MSAPRGLLLRRGGAMVGALLFAAIIAVSTEQARVEATPFGRALGVTPVEPRLAAIADAIAVSHRQPAAADLDFARQQAVRQPLSALPFFIMAGARPPEAVANARRLNALALRRDPRLRPAWAWLMTDRAKANDLAGTARALIRLGELSPNAEPIWAAAAQLSADPAARREIKAELGRGDAPWRDLYLTALSASTVDRAVVFEMLESAGKRAPSPPVGAAPATPDDRRVFLAQMIAQHDYERAYLAWVQWLPAGSQDAVGFVFDSGFRGLAALPPFAWELSDGVGGATTIDRATGLSLDYAGSDGAVLAKQMLLLPPGQYRLKTQADFQSVANENGTAPLSWTVTCVAAAKPLGDLAVPLEGSAKRAVSQPFDVAPGCDAQTLALTVTSADFAKRLSGTIRAVAIELVK